MRTAGFIVTRSFVVALVAAFVAVALAGGKVPTPGFFLAIFALLWVSWAIVAVRQRWSHRLIR